VHDAAVRRRGDLGGSVEPGDGHPRPGRPRGKRNRSANQAETDDAYA
jgi:hypothetical protein